MAQVQVGITVDPSGARQGARVVTKTFEDVRREARTMGNAVDAVTRGLRNSFSVVDTAARGTAHAIAEVQRATAVLGGAFEVAGMRAHDMAGHIRLAGQQAQASGAVAAAAATRMDVAMTRGTASTGRMGQAMQQAGYQVGDFAVQVGSGQNAIMAFTQQGTQLISMFGPWGAVVGAAGAIVGALVLSLTNLGDAANDAKGPMGALDDLTDDLAGTMRTAAGDADELARSYAGLSEEARTLESIMLNIAIRKAQDRLAENLESARNAMRDALMGAIPGGTAEMWRDEAEAIGQVNSALDATLDYHERAARLASPGVSEAYRAVTEAGAGYAATEREITAEIERRQAALDALNGIQGAATRAFEKAGDSAAKAGSKIADLATEYRLTVMEAEALGKAMTYGQDAYDDMKDAIALQREWSDVMGDLEGATYDQRMALKALHREAKEADRLKDALELINDALDAGKTDLERYQEQVSGINTALETLAARGLSLTADQLQSINEPIEDIPDEALADPELPTMIAEALS